MQYVGKTLRASITSRAKPGDGVFLTSCVQHEMAWNSEDSAKGPFGPTIGGCTHAEAVAAWVSEANSSDDTDTDRAENRKKGKEGEGLVGCQRVAVDDSDGFATLSAEPCNTGVFH